MAKQNASLKRCLLIGILSLLLFLALPARVTWAGLPAQTVPTMDPSLGTSSPTEKSSTAPSRVPTKAETHPRQNTPQSPSTTGNNDLVQSPTPRVFPTRANSGASEDFTATPTAPELLLSATSTPEAGPAHTAGSGAMVVTSTGVERPVTASLTAVAAEENPAGEKSASTSSLLFCSSGLIVVVMMIRLGFLFLRHPS